MYEFPTAAMTNCANSVPENDELLSYSCGRSKSDSGCSGLNLGVGRTVFLSEGMQGQMVDTEMAHG